MAYYKKGRALVGGDHVSVGARGKRAVADKGSNTKVIAKRGKKVAANSKSFVVSTSAKPKASQVKKTISRRGKNVSVTKKVRSM